MIVHTSSVLKNLIDELFKLLIGKRILEFPQRVGQPAVVPLVLLAVLDVEEVPEGVALLGVVTGDGPHVREFVAQCHYLRIVRGTGKPVDGGLLAGVVEGGELKADVMARYGIASLSPLETWCRAYREGGAEALRPKPKGRPKGSSSPPRAMTREQKLERRIQKLEAENAYLKKSIALKAEKRSRAARGPRP